jgi:hypothetical protein
MPSYSVDLDPQVIITRGIREMGQARVEGQDQVAARRQVDSLQCTPCLFQVCLASSTKPLLTMVVLLQMDLRSALLSA